MQKRYWLRGGAIAVLVCSILFLGSYITGYTHTVTSDELRFSVIGIAGYLSVEESIYYVASVLMVTFLVGSVLGWIYGKMKNRSDHNS